MTDEHERKTWRLAQSEALSIPVRACVFPTRNEGE